MTGFRLRTVSRQSGSIHSDGWQKAPENEPPFIVITTANALVQRCVPRAVMASQALHFQPGGTARMDDLLRWMSVNGFERTVTVRDRGEFAVRGGILDLYAPGTQQPIRLDFFGDTLESIRSFDLADQRTTGQLKSFSLTPMSEVTLDQACDQPVSHRLCQPVWRGNAGRCAVSGGK